MNRNKQEIQKKICKKYEFFDVTADVGFWAYGKSLNEVFKNAALAMFDVISDTKLVSETESRKISIESEDLISLLYDFLEELLIIHEIDLILFSNFDISIEKECNDRIISYKLKAVAIGEYIDWNVHERKSEVKAVTFHMMDVFYEDIFKARVILDL